MTIDEAKAACQAKGTMDAFAGAVGDLIAAFRGAGMTVGAMALAFEHEADALWAEEEREDEDRT